MKEKSWNDCIENQSVKKTTSDYERAKSLIETAEDRIGLVKEITEKNCNFVFEDYYTSIVEILQAIAFREGYNILNHICIGYFLKDKLGREDLFILFDDLRYKRNSLTYYGKRMDFETCKEAIEKCNILIKEIRKMIKNA
ncbi:MAG: hypothetical protein KatS3mg001_053 [Candidatus Pacearchaeota archaeon]|nr:MAG: hypothetical protein KatS3mg001_053 [Candidatus Pacearchaeota archaeon]